MSLTKPLVLAHSPRLYRLDSDSHVSFSSIVLLSVVLGAELNIVIIAWNATTDAFNNQL